MLARTLIVALLALGIARCYGFSLLDWIFSVFSVPYTAVAAILTAIWKLLHPTADTPQRYMPHLHQAILNVTRDATRVADLLEEFFAQQYRDDPTLKDKFMAYMSAQANTSYSVVDNQLSWILWLYSMLWVPLLAVLCFARASRSARQGQAGDTRAPAGDAGMQCISPQQRGSNNFLAAGRRDSTQNSVDHGSRAAEPQQGSLQPQLASASAANVCTLRRSATTAGTANSTYIAGQAQQLRASSEMFAVPQHKLASSASVPARTLGPSSSFKAGSSARSHSAYDSDVHMVDQYSSERDSARASLRSARSVVVRHQQGAATAAEPLYNWQMVS